MDYQKIYTAFIADRKRIENDLQGYTESHHILPRSLGGSDDPENLIRLTPEDHFFAHLLLAKATNNAKAWAACMILAGAGRNGRRPQEVRRALVRHRKVFGLVRRAWNKTSRGENAANADLAEYTFFHQDGRRFTGTRIAFSEYSGISSQNIDPLVRGDIASSCGWAMSRKAAESIERLKLERSSKSGKQLRGYIRDKNVYPFYRGSDGLMIVATQSAMVSLGYISRSGCSELCLGNRFAASGWCLLQNAEWAFDRANRVGEFCGAYISEIYEFRNSMTGEIVSSTVWAMGQKLNDGDSRPFGAIVSGSRRGWRGWHLRGSPEPRTCSYEYKFVRPSDGHTIRGKSSDLAKMLGVTRSAVYRAAKGYAPHVKGYSLCD